MTTYAEPLLDPFKVHSEEGIQMIHQITVQDRAQI